MLFVAATLALPAPEELEAITVLFILLNLWVCWQRSPKTFCRFDDDYIPASL